MASIIAGHGDGFDDEDGITGIAPEAKILSIRVIPDTTDPGLQEIQRRAGVDHPEGAGRGDQGGGRPDHAQVISMSIGYSAPSEAVRAALQYAYSRGVVLVASSGNSGDNDEQHGTPAPTAGRRYRSRPSTRA